MHVMTNLFILFENLHKCEKIMKREYLISFMKKKSLDLQKNKNHVATFSYWFCFGHNFLNV
jgi:hypothetical protein